MKIGLALAATILMVLSGGKIKGQNYSVSTNFVGWMEMGTLNAEAGMPVAELCRKHAFSEASYYLWRSKFGGMSVSDAKRLKELETENTRLKKLLAETMLENEIAKEALRKKW